MEAKKKKQKNNLQLPSVTRKRKKSEKLNCMKRKIFTKEKDCERLLET